MGIAPILRVARPSFEMKVTCQKDSVMSYSMRHGSLEITPE